MYNNFHVFQFLDLSLVHVDHGRLYANLDTIAAEKFNESKEVTLHSI